MSVMGRLLFLFLLCVAAGCSRQIAGPSFDPKDAAAKAFAEYDQNRDGFLDAQELERCPALLSLLKRFDKDNDGRLSRDELESGLTAFLKGDVALMGVTCWVKLDDQPLPDAEVLLEPESFLGPSFKPVRGTTNEKGQVKPHSEGAPIPACYVGLYRVRIRKSVDGQETIPSRYNTETQLGIAVGSGEKGIYYFQLTSR